MEDKLYPDHLKDSHLLLFLRYYSYVMISMEALDTLLVTCHAQSLNLFVESFLKMVQKLLECNDAALQCLATQSVSSLVAICQSLILYPFKMVYLSRLYCDWIIWVKIIYHVRFFAVCQVCQHRRRHSLLSQTLRLLRVQVQLNVSH